MGTEYALGVHVEEIRSENRGSMYTDVILMAYEMSGTYDVYADVPKDLVELDAWKNEHRVNLWSRVDPIELYKIGKRFIEVASYNLSEEEIRALK